MEEKIKALINLTEEKIDNKIFDPILPNISLLNNMLEIFRKDKKENEIKMKEFLKELEMDLYKIKCQCPLIKKNSRLKDLNKIINFHFPLFIFRPDIINFNSIIGVLFRSFYITKYYDIHRIEYLEML